MLPRAVLSGDDELADGQGSTKATTVPGSLSRFIVSPLPFNVHKENLLEYDPLKKLRDYLHLKWHYRV